LTRSLVRVPDPGPKAPLAGPRNDRAVLFATDNYKIWSPLRNPVADAKAIADVLGPVYGFTTQLVEAPSKEQILATLREYAQLSYRPQDQLLVFFAGHGFFDEIFNDGYLVAATDPRPNRSNSEFLPMSYLRTVLDSIPCPHILVIIDACFAGAFDQRIGEGPERGDVLYDPVSPDEFIGRRLAPRTRRYLTSGGKRYVPDGRPGQHSPFVRALLAGLDTRGGKDQILTLAELYGYLERVRPEPRIGEFGGNQPGSDFLFITRPSQPGDLSPHR
jgi:hypothetical protein